MQLLIHTFRIQIKLSIQSVITGHSVESDTTVYSILVGDFQRKCLHFFFLCLIVGIRDEKVTIRKWENMK